MKEGNEVTGQSLEPEVGTQLHQSHMESPKMIPQDKVNEIVARAKQDAIESYKRKSQEQPEYASQRYGSENKAQLGEQDFRRLAAEEAKRLHEELMQDARSKSETEAARRVVESFYNKVNAGKGKYEDFDAVTGDMELKNFPNVVQMLADHVDNSHDVLYELGKNRLKLAQLEQLSYMSPRDAIREAQRLAQSIKANEEAANIRQPNSPLKQERSSNVGTDTGVLSVSDYRNKYRG